MLPYSQWGVCAMRDIREDLKERVASITGELDELKNRQNLLSSIQQSLFGLLEEEDRRFRDRVPVLMEPTPKGLYSEPAPKSLYSEPAPKSLYSPKSPRRTASMARSVPRPSARSFPRPSSCLRVHGPVICEKPRAESQTPEPGALSFTCFPWGPYLTVLIGLGVLNPRRYWLRSNLGQM